jgi:hypothetical protein
LDRYETAIWLDIDIAIQASIAELSQYGPLGMAPDMALNRLYTRFPRQINFNKPVPAYDMDAPGYCSAVVVANHHLKGYRELYNWLWEKSVEYAEYLANPDQGIINLAIEEFALNVNAFSWDEYECFPTVVKANVAKIVHFGTTSKIWNKAYLLRAFPEWYRTHLEWLKLGGDDFDRTGMNTSNILFKLYKKYPKWFISFLCFFIPKKKNRDRLRAKYSL